VSFLESVAPITLLASVNPTEAGNAKSRIALGVSDRAVHQRAAVTSTNGT
jgi:hypothetical protein